MRSGYKSGIMCGSKKKLCGYDCFKTKHSKFFSNSAKGYFRGNDFYNTKHLTIRDFFTYLMCEISVCSNFTISDKGHFPGFDFYNTKHSKISAIPLRKVLGGITPSPAIIFRFQKIIKLMLSRSEF